MTSYSVALDSVSVLSTATPFPRWDRLLMTANLELHVRDSEGKDPTLLATKSGDIGYGRAGHAVDLKSLTTADGTSWRFDLPDDLDTNADLRLSVIFVNVRDLDDNSVERLLAKLGILTAEVAATVLVHTPSKVAEVAVAATFGLTGFGLEKLVDEILGDPPKCSGRKVFQQYISLRRSDLELLELQEEAPSPPGSYSSQDVFSSPRMEGFSPGEDCGTFCANLKYAIQRTTQFAFAPSVKLQTTYAELDFVRPSSIQGHWADEPSSASSTPLVKVNIQPTSKPFQDGFNVSVKEFVWDGNRPVTVVESDVADLQFEKVAMLRPSANVFGAFQPQLIGGGKFTPNLEVLLKRPGSGLPEPGIMAELNTLRRLSDLQLTYPGIDLGVMLKVTTAILLPDDVQLSFWAKLSVGPQVKLIDIAMRYQRGTDLTATATDVWMAPHSPVD